VTTDSSGTQEKKKGSLTVVGTGIQAIGHLTAQARANIASADVLFYLVTDPVAEHYIKGLNPCAHSLFPLYGKGKERMKTYEEMVETILRGVRDGNRVCAAFYGHPGVFVYPSHVVVRRALSEGYEAEMLPAVSAEDCLFADLNVDPGIPGCQSFEASDFLVFRRRFDQKSSLILWQIGVIGLITWWEEGFNSRPGLEALRERLMQTYPPEHKVVIYEAAHLPTLKPRRDAIQLRDLASAEVSPISTLYVPPYGLDDMDTEMLMRLGIDPSIVPRRELVRFETGDPTPTAVPAH
jgi:uncharacterized protein YabN with tetrapyrrole methylase and pyrophosphatase domain